MVGEEFDALESSCEDLDAGRAAGGLAGVACELGDPARHFADRRHLAGAPRLLTRRHHGGVDLSLVEFFRRGQVGLRSRQHRQSLDSHGHGG